MLIRGLGYRNMFIAIEIDGGNQRYDIHFCIIICTNCYATFDFDHFYFLVLMFFVNYIINLFNVYVQTILGKVAKSRIGQTWEIVPTGGRKVRRNDPNVPTLNLNLKFNIIFFK